MPNQPTPAKKTHAYAMGMIGIQPAAHAATIAATQSPITLKLDKPATYQTHNQTSAKPQITNQGHQTVHQRENKYTWCTKRPAPETTPTAYGAGGWVNNFPPRPSAQEVVFERPYHAPSTPPHGASETAAGTSTYLYIHT